WPGPAGQVMMRQKLALVVSGSPSLALSRINGFSPVKITRFGSAGITGGSLLKRLRQGNPNSPITERRRDDQDHPGSPRARRRQLPGAVSRPRRSGADPAGPPAGGRDRRPHRGELDSRRPLFQPAEPVSGDGGGGRKTLWPDAGATPG